MGFWSRQALRDWWRKPRREPRGVARAAPGREMGELDVTAPDPQIRLLTCADALAYRGHRLKSLRRKPEAFASTFEDERDKSPDWFKALITQSRIFGAVLAQELVGVVGLRSHADAKQRHEAGLWGMYVLPRPDSSGTAIRSTR